MPRANRPEESKSDRTPNLEPAGRPRENDNPLCYANKMAKKNFKKRIKQISREYEEEKVVKAVKSAELDHTIFWKMLKRERERWPTNQNPFSKE